MTIEEWHCKGYAVMSGAGGYFEGMSWMRGPETTMMELVSDDPIIGAVVERFVYQCNVLAFVDAVREFGGHLP